MDKNNTDSLLKPSLSRNRKVGQPFSSISHFLLSWFGGGISAALFCILSARKMGLIKQKCIELIFLLVISLVATFYFFTIRLGIVMPPFGIDENVMSKVIKIVTQAFGVVIYGIFYLMFNKYLLSARMSNEPIPSPWLSAVICGGVGYALTWCAGFILFLLYYPK